MLFKNLKSGNLVEAKDSVTVELMTESPYYEAVVTLTTAPKAEKPAKKTMRSTKK